MPAFLCFVLAHRRWVMAAVALLTVFFGLQIGGSVPQTSTLAETLVRGKLHNIAQMMAVVLVAGALVFRSLWAGVVLALPLAMAVMVNFGVMGLTGIPLNTPTSVSAAMTIGLGADYAIYLLYRMREEMARCGDLDQAINHSLRSAGQAVIYVATAIAGGYSVLLLSAGFYIHIWFGVLIVVSTLVSALSALVLVPALVRSHPPRFLWPAAWVRCCRNRRRRKPHRAPMS